MRLDKFLSNTGTCSRREAKVFVKKRKVTVNGEVPKSSDTDIDEDKDIIMFSGTQIVLEKEIYFMLNKPQGYVSANSDKEFKTVFELLDYELQKKALFIAGRLDKDTEGFLLFTNNGEFAHNMLSPKKHVPKTYFAEIDGEVTQEHIQIFKKGMEIDKGDLCLPADLVIMKSGDVSQINLTIQEGKFHQVKRMFEAVGTKVTYLKRIKIGGLELDESLKLGQYKKLSKEDITKIGTKQQ